MKRADTLLLYRRHHPKCPHADDRSWMDCTCPIWIVGRTPDGTTVRRKSTGFTDLAQARHALATVTKPVHDRNDCGPTIADSARKYLADRQQELGEMTLGQHRLVLDRLVTFCEARGKSYMRDLTVDLLLTFKAEGFPAKMRDTSKKTFVAKLRCFLRAAYERDWIATSLVEKVRGHKAVYGQKEPYTDQEVQKILDEALKMNGRVHGYAKHPKTFRLLLELMLETGIRVSDAVRFDPSSLIRGEHLWVYRFVMQKRKRSDALRYAEVYLSDRLKGAIDAADWFSPKRPFMYNGNGRASAYQVYLWMQNIGTRSGVSDCRPHRLRDTFAVRKLLSGLQLDDVSRLLGHSSVKMTELFYAKWVDSRRQRLERLVAESLVNA
ncbi:MAG: tyrosine-type recombinase/integrase [Bryobacteraceae bacterium]